MNAELERAITNKELAGVPLREHVSFLERVDHFTWAWGVFPMATGAIALLLGAQPHTFRGLEAIGKIFFIFDLVIIVVMLAMLSTRFARDPTRLGRSFHNATEALFFPTTLISLAIVIALIWRYGHASCGGWLQMAVRVLFWIYYAVSFLSAVIQYWYLFSGVQFTVRGMTPGWLLPVFPHMLCGVVAGFIATGQPMHHRLPICVGGLLAQGFGFLLGVIIYSPWIQRMMEFGLPPPKFRPGMFLAVGPPSFTALALITIPKALPPNVGYLAQHPGSLEIFQALGLASAIFMWTLGFWFFCVTLLAIVAGAREMAFHLACWALVFPNVGLTIALIEIGHELESEGILWVGTAMSLFLVALYLFVFQAHIRAFWNHDIMWPGKDEDKDEVKVEVKH